MVRIKVEYDKYSRTFKLLDKELASALVDREVYEIPISFMIDGLDEEDCSSSFSVPLAHA